MRKSTWLPLVLLVAVSQVNLKAAYGAQPESYGDAYLEEVDGLPVLHVKGSYRQMGRQYGFLVGDRVETLLSVIHGYVGNQVGGDPNSGISSFLVGALQRTVGLAFWTQFPESSKELIRGVVEGARKRKDKVQLDFLDLAFANSLIDIAGITGQFDKNRISGLLRALGISGISSNCDSFAAWGPLTEGGKTFQTRNTDIEVGSGLERFPLVVVYKPKHEIPFVSAGFTGMVGVFTGMNAYGVGVGQIWAKSKKFGLGTPWQLNVARAFSQAKTAYDAVKQFESYGHRTYGNNFVFADGSGHGYAVETNAAHFQVFTDDDPKEELGRYHGELYAYRIPYAVLRADISMDPSVRSEQTADNGPDGDPRTSGAYINRYKGQADLILDYRARGVPIGQMEAEHISRATGQVGSSFQAAVYANTDRNFWVSYARFLEDGSVQEARLGTYHAIPFSKYIPTLLQGPDGTLVLKSWSLGEETISPSELRVTRGGKEVFRGAVESVGLLDLSFKPSPGDELELLEPGSGSLLDRLVVAD